MWENIIIQFIGFIGTAFLVFSFQIKNTQKLFLVQMISNLFYIVHFLLLNAYSGCISMVLNLIRNIVLATNFKWSKWKFWPYIFIIIQFIALKITWQDAFSILPCLGNIAIIIAGWSQSAKNVRLANMCVNSPCWLIYDIYTFSISGIVCELFCQASTILSIYRYGWHGLDNQ